MNSEQKVKIMQIISEYEVNINAWDLELAYQSDMRWGDHVSYTDIVAFLETLAAQGFITRTGQKGGCIIYAMNNAYVPKGFNDAELCAAQKVEVIEIIGSAGNKTGINAWDIRFDYLEKSRYLKGIRFCAICDYLEYLAGIGFITAVDNVFSMPLYRINMEVSI